jgi:sterol 24-C-methyltransferase
MALDDTFNGQPWWLYLHPSNNPFTFRFQLSPLGKFMTHTGICLVPSGTYKVQSMLQQGGWGCAEGGHKGTFTPMFLMVARKPLQ